MINEMIELSRSLVQHGIEVPVVHADIKSVKKSAFLLVVLSDKGVSAVHLRNVQQMSEYAAWTLRNGQQNSFPAISLKGDVEAKGTCPLLDHSKLSLEALALASGVIKRDGKDQKVDPVVQTDALKELLHTEVDPSGLGNWPGYRDRIEQRVEQLSPLIGGDAEHIQITFRRFLDATADPVDFFESFLRKVADGIAIDVKNIGAVSSLVLDGNAQLYFDVVESKNRRPVGHSAHRSLIAGVLNHGTTPESQSGYCVVSGTQETLHSGNFPQLNLPYLGQTYLYSRNDVTPSSHRYGTTKLSISSETVLQLAGALDWMCDGGRGVRWTNLKGEKDGQNDLLIAFSKSDPDLPLVAMLAGDNEADANENTISFGDFGTEVVKDESVFDASSRVVIEALAEQATGGGSVPEVIVTLLRQVDPANRTAIYTANLSANLFVNAATDWKNAFSKKHLPSIRVRLPVRNKGDRAIWAKLRSIAPLRLIELSRRRYVDGGAKRVEVVGLPAAGVMEVFCGSAPHVATLGLLQRLVSQCFALLTLYGRSMVAGFNTKDKIDSFAVLDTLSAFHLLLSKLDRPGEIYMTKLAFQLGQFLSGCDQLHVGYCLDQRGGQIPPKLLGNAHVATAGSNPVQALEMLQRRLPVYYAWADKARRDGGISPESVKTDKERRTVYDIRNGFFAPIHLKKLATSISSQIDLEAVDNRFRAELLLGYVAGLDRPESAAKEAKTKDSTP